MEQRSIDSMRVAVIGGGPAGIVTLKYLVTAHQSLGCAPVQAQLFEDQSQVGGTFAARSYEDSELVSSRQLTAFSDFRHDGPDDFLRLDAYVQYLQDYCTHFKLWPSIKLQTRVVAVARRGEGGHTVFYESVAGGPRLSYDCDAVAVCSGLHVTPNLPIIPGLERVPIVMHSSRFKVRKQFGIDKTVMIIGTGETGADVAYLAVTSPTRRTISSPVFLPILGRKPNPANPTVPLDVSRANIFDTTYVHPLLRDHTILWDYNYYQIKVNLWLSFGTTQGKDQWIGGINRRRDHPSKIFFNKSSAVAPYISEPYRPRHPGRRLWLYALRSALVQAPITDTQGKTVDLAPMPSDFDAEGYAIFTDNGRPEYQRLKNERIKPDVVVLCTGYKQEFPFLEASEELSMGEIPYPRPADADVRGIWQRTDPSVAFIGFMRPSLGAIPPLAEMQAQLWVANLLAPHKLPSQHFRPEEETHFRLHHPPGSRIQYGVDHESYAYQMALDLGSAPGITDIFRIMDERPGFVKPLKLLLIWIWGANFNTKYRLGGPWKWNGAYDVLVSDEFWHTLTRRSIFGHIYFSVLPMMVFGPMSAVVCLYATLMGTWMFSWSRPGSRGGFSKVQNKQA